MLWIKILKREVAKIYEEHEDVLFIESLRVLRARISIFVSSRFKRLVMFYRMFRIRVLDGDWIQAG